jgi:hypothetical protein
VACAKLNISENRQGFTFKITDGIINILDEYVDVTADEMLQERMANNQEKRQHGPKPKKFGNCFDWMLGFLAARAVWGVEVYEKALEAGYSKATVDRVKKELKIEPERDPISGRYMWSLPQDIWDNYYTESNLSHLKVTQVTFEGSDNLSHLEQSLENKGFENNIKNENFEVTQVTPIHIGNLSHLEENQSILPISTVETNCGKDEKSDKKPDEAIIIKTKKEMQERVKHFDKSKEERLERLNRQVEENLKKSGIKNTENLKSR